MVKNVTMANHRIDDGKVMVVLEAYDTARIVYQRVSISEFFLGVVTAVFFMITVAGCQCLFRL